MLDLQHLSVADQLEAIAQRRLELAVHVSRIAPLEAAPELLEAGSRGHTQGKSVLVASVTGRATG
jgi:hypothetical protein